MTLHDLLGIARHMLNADREEMRDLGAQVAATFVRAAMESMP